MTRADHVYDNNWDKCADENGQNINYAKLVTIYHKEFDDYQSEKESVIESLQERLKSQIENVSSLNTDLTAAQAEIAELKELIKREVVPDIKDAEIARLKEDLKEVTSKHLSLGLTCDRLSDEKLEVKKLLSNSMIYQASIVDANIDLNTKINGLESALDVAVEALGATWPNVFQEIYEHHQAALDKIKQIRG